LLPATIAQPLREPPGASQQQHVCFTSPSTIRLTSVQYFNRLRRVMSVSFRQNRLYPNPSLAISSQVRFRHSYGNIQAMQRRP
jgi:hypothetical protein